MQQCIFFFFLNVFIVIIINDVVITIMTITIIVVVVHHVKNVFFCILSLKSPAGQWHTVLKVALILYMWEQWMGKWGYVFLKLDCFFFLYLESISNENKLKTWKWLLFVIVLTFVQFFESWCYIASQGLD